MPRFMPRFESSSLPIPTRPAAALLTAGALTLAALLALPARHALAGDVAAPPAPETPALRSPAEAAPAPRQAALDAAIRRLERHLALLRKARTELVSNRPEPSATDETARRRADAGPRGLREISRYEAARARALAALDGATAAKDTVKAGEAAAALEALDSRFADTMKKFEESLDDPAKAGAKAAVAPGAKPGAGAKAGDDSKGGDPKAGTSAPRTRRKASKPAGDGSMSEGGASDEEVADDDDTDADDVDHDE